MTVDALSAYGLVRMDEAAIPEFLATQSTGVLGLPADPAPYLLPMSYGYDGDRTLYFTYVLGGEGEGDESEAEGGDGAGGNGRSRKRALTEGADRARFLVYSADTPFEWTSVLLTGHLERLDAEAAVDLGEDATGAWRPDLFERAAASGAVAVYRLRVADWSGIRHTGLPEEFRGGRAASTGD